MSTLRNAFLYFIMAFVGIASAAEFDILQTTSLNCGIYLSGTDHIYSSEAGKNDLVFQGAKNNGGCMAIVSIKKFNQRYSYCALSSLEVQPNARRPLSCAFNYYDSEHKNVIFRSYPAGILCSFVCIKS